LWHYGNSFLLRTTRHNTIMPQHHNANFHPKQSTIMKNLLLVILVSFAFIGTSNAQFMKAGLKFGVSTYDMKLGDFVVTNGNKFDNLTDKIDDSSFGYQFGLYARLGRGLHIQPEIVFNSNKLDFQTSVDGDQFNTTETFNNIDVPILVGLKLGPLRAQAGPVARFYLGDDEKVSRIINNYQDDEDRLKVGYQAGFGLDLWRISLDFRYEGSLKHFGDIIDIDGKAFSLDNKAGRAVVSMGIAF